jgi:hypothetical protein
MDNQLNKDVQPMLNKWERNEERWLEEIGLSVSVVRNFM